MANTHSTRSKAKEAVELRSEKLTKTREEYWVAYGKRLRLTRLVLGLTEHEAAKAHWVTVTTYRKWEAGAAMKDGNRGVVFAEDHKVSLDWLVCGNPANLGQHLSVNPGGKLAILPVVTGDVRKRRQIADFYAEVLR